MTLIELSKKLEELGATRFSIHAELWHGLADNADDYIAYTLWLPDTQEHIAYNVKTVQAVLDAYTHWLAAREHTKGEDIEIEKSSA